MSYEVLFLNSDGLTARVSLVIGSNTLNQDFPLGSSMQEFESNILQGLANFQNTITLNTPPAPPFDISNLIDVVTAVNPGSLPPSTN